MAPTSAAIHQRIALNGSIGTIAYIGVVSGTSGSWLGIDWDDPSRGKHDGSKDGARYFNSHSPTSGSFIRPTAVNLDFGRSFLAALRDKYIEEEINTVEPEMVTLGSSDGAILVEAVNMNKVRSKFARLETLREVGLESSNISTVTEPSSIRTLCPNIRNLDLSRNLIGNWGTVTELVSQLVHLEILALNYNVFEPLHQPLPETPSKLMELRLNGTRLAWNQLSFILSAFRSLVRVEYGHNGLDSIFPLELSQETLIETINLERNDLSEWRKICNALSSFPKLNQIFLSDNKIDTIPKLEPNDRVLDRIHSLVIQSNNLSAWYDLDALTTWMPCLVNFSMVDNPLLSDRETLYSSRQLIIGHIPTLKKLHSTTISPEERQDAELFYLSVIVKQCPPTRRSLEHPRWSELVEKHGQPDGPSPENDKHGMQKRLFDTTLVRLDQPPSHGALEPDPASIAASHHIGLLPTMGVRTVLMKACKLFSKRSSTQPRMFLWLVPQQGVGRWAELEVEASRSKDLQWWGVEQGSFIGVYFPPDL